MSSPRSSSSAFGFESAIPSVSSLFWIAASALILLLDCTLGPDLQVNFLLAVPVFLLAWHKGVVPALTLGVTAACVRFGYIANLGFPIGFAASAGNFVIRLCCLSLLAMIAGRISHEFRVLQAKAAAAGGIAGEGQEPAATTEFAPFSLVHAFRPLALGERLKLPLIQAACRYPRLVRCTNLAPWQPHALSDVHQMDYDIIVDGYPRSANSFLSKALELIRPGLRVRSHRHWPTHVIEALNRGKAACLLLRHPVDAIASTSILINSSLAYALERYIAYYQALLPHRQRLLVVSFEAATGDLSAVCTELNRRFGLALLTAAPTPQLLAEIKTRVRELEWGRDPMRVSLPSSERYGTLEQLKARLESPVHKERLQVAETLYEQFMAGALQPRPKAEVELAA